MMVDKVDRPWEPFLGAFILDHRGYVVAITDGYVDACGVLMLNDTPLVNVRFAAPLTPMQQSIVDRSAEGFD